MSNARFYVPGESSLWVQPPGVDAASFLGVTLDGVDIRLMPHYVPVYSDAVGGADANIDELLLQAPEAEISCDLIKFDPNIMQRIIALTTSTSVSGAVAEIGTSMRWDGSTFRLFIQTLYERDWNFLDTALIRYQQFKLSAKRTAWNLSFHAFMSTDQLGNRVLYNNDDSEIP